MTDSGVPQGGVISPMIANFVLDGLETKAFEGCKKTQVVNIPTTGYERSTIKEKSEGAGRYTRIPKTTKTLQVSRILVRFADDFVVVTTDEKDIPIVEGNLKTFLGERGIAVNFEKSKVLKWSPGEVFDFLGYTFRKVDVVKPKGIVVRRNDMVDNRVLIHPKLSKLKEIKKKVKTIILDSQNLTASELVKRLNPVIRG